MVRIETFQEIKSRVRQAKLEKEHMDRANSMKVNKKSEKTGEELFPYRKGQKWDHALYGAPYAHPKLEANRFWTIPGKRACQGTVMDLMLGSIMKVYKNLMISLMCVGAAIASFVLMPGMFAAIGIIFLLFAGRHFMEWRNWYWYHRFNMERLTVIRAMGNEMYYPRLKYKKGVIPFKPI